MYTITHLNDNLHISKNIVIKSIAKPLPPIYCLLQNIVSVLEVSSYKQLWNYENRRKQYDIGCFL